MMISAGAVLRWDRRGNCPPTAPKPEPCPPNLWLQQQYAVVKPANTYTGGVSWRVNGVADLVVLVYVFNCFEGDD